MSSIPHPSAFMVVAELRRADVHAQVDNLRLVKLAQTSTDRRRPWSDLPAPRALATVLALLAAFQRGW